MEIGGLTTADPLDPAVAAWWKAKADEIYAATIPDFGGFLVKANSEGQPGPQRLRPHARRRRQHAGGRARAARRHRDAGARSSTTTTTPDDRAKQAYNEFVPLDGQFRAERVLQVKNGAHRLPAARAVPPAVRRDAENAAADRVPDHAGVSRLRDASGLPRPLFEEVLDADTYAEGRARPVAKVVDGTLDGHPITGIAGVCQHRRRPQLDRHPLRPGQLVRFRPAGVGPPR